MYRRIYLVCIVDILYDFVRNNFRLVRSRRYVVDTELLHYYPCHCTTCGDTSVTNHNQQGTMNHDRLLFTESYRSTIDLYTWMCKRIEMFGKIASKVISTKCVSLPALLIIKFSIATIN